MPDAPVADQTTDAGVTPAESTSPPPEAPSAKAVSSAFADFDAVFGGGSSGGGKATGTASNPPAISSGVPANAATAEGGADEADEDGADAAEATTSTGEQPPKPLSRTARIHEEYKGQIETLKGEHQTQVTDLATKVSELQRQLDEATGKVSETEQQRRAGQAAFTEAFGDDAEYDRRTRIANRMFDAQYTGPQLTNDEALELARWTTNREHADPIRQKALAEARTIVERTTQQARDQIQQAGRQWQEYIAAETISRVDKYGLSPDVVQRAQYGELIDHAVDVTTKRLSEQHAAEIAARDATISGLEADLVAAQTAALGYRSEPERGGNSADVRVTSRRVFDSKAPLDQQWDAAFGPRGSGASVR